MALGETYHNPGNLEDYGIPWKGLVGRGNGRLCIFDTDQDGLRALALDLVAAQRRHDLRTIATIIPRFAPASDGNNVAAYVADVAEHMERDADDVLDLTDFPTLLSFMRGVIHHEQGRCVYSDQQIAAAASDALHIVHGPRRDP